MSVRARFRLYLEFARPFTLFAPALGMASGGATAIGAAPRESWSGWLVIYPLVGALMAATLNAASNGLNQIYDLDIDAVNKPKRPLPSGRMTFREAWAFTLLTFAAAWLLAWVDRARRAARVLLAGRRGHDHHHALLGAAVPHQAPRHLGQPDGGRSRAARCSRSRAGRRSRR